MEYMQGYQYMPGDQRLVEHIVYELKSHGIFDQFRKDCLADVDTKPAYQNLRQRVEGSVSVFLNSQKWKPEMNKNQLREKLRKTMQESGFLETGVERIVDQVVNPKISTVFLPQVEEVVYKYLGIEKPHKNENEKVNGSEKLEICTDLLPTDLEAISPDSVSSSKNINNTELNNFSPKQPENDDTSAKESKTEEFESPPFEPLVEKGQLCDENSNDSHLSGISGLTSQGSMSPKRNDVELDNTNQDSHLSRVSSGSQISVHAIPVATEDSAVKCNIENIDNANKTDDDDVDKPSSIDNNIELKMDVDSSMSYDSDTKGLVIITESSNEAVDYKIMTDNGKEQNKSKENENGNSKNKESESDISKSKSPSKSDKNKSHSSRKRSSNSHSHSDRHSSSHHHKSKHRHHDKNDDKRDKSKKYKTSRENKDEKDSSKKSYHSSKDRKDKDKHESDSKHKSNEKHHNGKSKSPRSDSSKSRSSGHSKSSNKNSDEHSASEPKDHKDKPKKKSKLQDDHSSAKNQKSVYRRSTDRDSNDGSGAGIKKHTSSSHSVPSGNKQKENTAENLQSNSSNETSGNTNAKTRDTSLNSKSQKLQNQEHESSKSSIAPELRKPKIASNIYEARKLIKVRRKMERQAQKRRNRELKSKLLNESSDIEMTTNAKSGNEYENDSIVSEKDEADAKDNSLSDGSQFFGFTEDHKVFYDLDTYSNSDEMEVSLKENLSASSGNECEENHESKPRSKAEIMEIIFGRDMPLQNADGDHKISENGSFQVSYCSDYDDEEQSEKAKSSQINNNIHKKRKLNDDSSKMQKVDNDLRKSNKKNQLNNVDQSKLSNLFKKSDTNISNVEENNEDMSILKTPKSRSSIYHTQCYTNEDLYKPRPSFGSSRRRKVSAL